MIYYNPLHYCIRAKKYGELSHLLASLSISDDVCLSQFAKIEQGDDSIDVENNFA